MRSSYEKNYQRLFVWWGLHDWRGGWEIAVELAVGCRLAWIAVWIAVDGHQGSVFFQERWTQLAEMVQFLLSTLGWFQFLLPMIPNLEQPLPACDKNVETCGQVPTPWWTWALESTSMRHVSGSFETVCSPQRYGGDRFCSVLFIRVNEVKVLINMVN